VASWIAALKLVPWGEVIKATPQVVNRPGHAQEERGPGRGARAGRQRAKRCTAHFATGLRRRAGAAADPAAGKRIAQLEQSQRQSLEIIEKLAQQNAQIVATVGALRIGAQRLAWACGVLGLCVIGLGVYLFSR
jgi:hypothetical protein